MKPAKVSKIVNFTCGCLSEYVYLGDQSHHPDEKGKPQKLDWHVVPCTSCAPNRVPGELERRSEEAWQAACLPSERTSAPVIEVVQS